VGTDERGWRRADLAPEDAAPRVAAGYDRMADRFRSWADRMPAGSTERFLDEIRAVAPDRPLVLDLGCGDGHPVAAGIGARRYVGVDLSAEQLARARARWPAAGFVLADLHRFEAREASVDLITACYSLTHLTPAAQRRLIVAMAGWVRPGGVVAFTASAATEEHAGIEEGWLGVPMFFAGIPADETLALVREAGLRIVLGEPRTLDEGDGTAAFLYVIAARP
jgi:SAM-dependent methyltransferase